MTTDNTEKKADDLNPFPGNLKQHKVEPNEKTDAQKWGEAFAKSVTSKKVPAPLPKDGEEKIHLKMSDHTDGIDFSAPAEMSAEDRAMTFLVPRLQKFVAENPADYLLDQNLAEAKETKVVAAIMREYAAEEIKAHLDNFIHYADNTSKTGDMDIRDLKMFADSYIKNNLKG